MTFDGRQPFIKVDDWWKTTLNERRHLMKNEDVLRFRSVIHLWGHLFIRTSFWSRPSAGSKLACLPTCMPTCPTAHPPAYIPACLPTYLSFHLPACPPAAHLSTHLSKYLKAQIPTCLSACLPTYLVWQYGSESHNHLPQFYYGLVVFA